MPWMARPTINVVLLVDAADLESVHFLIPI
jgi:hypothetical protein